jgi:hypothetical protein
LVKDGWAKLAELDGGRTLDGNDYWSIDDVAEANDLIDKIEVALTPTKK